MAPEELKDMLDFIISFCQQMQKIEIQLNFTSLVKAVTTCPELAEGQNGLPVYYCITMHAASTASEVCADHGQGLHKSSEVCAR